MNNNHLNVNNIACGGTAKVSADDGKIFRVTAIHNGHTSAATVAFADDSALNTITVGAGASVDLGLAPVVCSSFTPSHASISVFYHA
tara:strand:- start:246 stop:506 length:261 start_codon:yes stop_codon:yes gene_type:complete